MDYNNFQQMNPNGHQSQNTEEQQKKKTKSKEKGMGSFTAKCVVGALVFGLVGGGTFTGVNYAGQVLLGASSTTEKTKTEKETNTTKTPASTKDYTTGAVKQVDTASLQAVDVSGIAEALMPSIVAITNYSTVTYQGIYSQQSQASTSCGSGIIVAQDENNIYIATNNHVVSGAETLTVQFSDGSVVDATVKGTYQAKDLAVAQVAVSEISSETLETIRLAEIGDSTELLVGETAIAIGNALGYGQSVTTGVISALGRELSVADDTGVVITNGNLIQTDAAINPGNSGGALINGSGQVIGINSAKYSDTSVEGFGFAIPMEDAWPIITQLISREKVDEAKAAYLGIQGQDVTASVAKANGMPQGIYVVVVMNNSPASKAGILAGDVVTGFDGQTVYSMQALKDLMAYYTEGTNVEVTLERADASGEYVEHTVTVTLGNMNQMTN